MLLADGSSVPPEYMGLFMMTVLALLGGAVAVKSLMTARADKEAVPRKDFDELKLQVTATIAGQLGLTAKLTEYVTRTEINTLRNELTQQLEKIDQYARGRNHKLAEKVSELQLSMEALHRNIQTEINMFVGKLMDRLERNQIVLHELRATIEKRIPVIENEEKK